MLAAATVAASVLGTATATRADDLTLDRFLGRAERIAPPYGEAGPGKVFCVCQSNDPNENYLGYLASYTTGGQFGTGVALVCSYPLFNGIAAGGYCAHFQVVK